MTEKTGMSFKAISLIIAHKIKRKEKNKQKQPSFDTLLSLTKTRPPLALEKAEQISVSVSRPQNNLSNPMAR